MSDDTGKKDDSEKPTGDSAENKDTVAKSDYEALQKQHDENAARARKAEKELRELKNASVEDERKRAEADGDLQKQLELANTRTAELEEARQKTEAALHQRVIDSEVLAIASKHSSNPKAVLALARSHFSVETLDDGSTKAVTTGGASLDAFIEGFVSSELPETKLSSRSKGTTKTELKKSSQADDGPALHSNQELDDMNPRERKKALIKGGDKLRGQYLQHKNS